MGRTPCCEKTGLKKGPWTPEEDRILVSYIRQHGHGNWRALPEQAGLSRCGKSCRLRWINYLRPDIKHGNFTVEEEDTIMKMHQMLGNRWSAIAAKLSGRTDNEIKNHWRTHLKKRWSKNMINVNAKNSSQMINSHKYDSRLMPHSLSTMEDPTNMKRRQDSKQISQDGVTMNVPNKVDSTHVTSAMKDSEDGGDHGNSEVLNEDFWADMLTDSSISMEFESGFGVESWSSFQMPSTCDVTTNSPTWWHGGDNMDCILGSFMNNNACKSNDKENKVR